MQGATVSEFRRLRYPATEAVGMLGLPRVLAARLTRRLDRTLADCRSGRGSLRDAVREAAALLTSRGWHEARVARTLFAVVVEHARERGWDEQSVVSGSPRAGAVARLVEEWARERCGLAR
ncbi:MAG TPA: hypothetical protein VEA99_14765 [Gemmatimonadaceae bacterium]|nr:hypothetical protein [Gemmatimonadaceae bacterium]